MTASLKRLKGKGKIFLTAIGVVWKEIRGFLEGEYITNIDTYASRITKTADYLRGANYYVVCTPERGPVNQTEEVIRIINGFGGTPCAYIVNNMRGATHEEVALAPLERHRSIPLVRIPHMEQIHTGDSVSASLVQVGWKTLLAVDLAERVT